MPTEVIFSGSPGRYTSIAFSGHSAVEDGDRDTGLRLCAAMSTLASVVEAHMETLGIGYSLSVDTGETNGKPVRSIRWDIRDADKVDSLSATIRMVVSLLAMQYPDYIQIRDIG